MNGQFRGQQIPFSFPPVTSSIIIVSAWTSIVHLSIQRRQGPRPNRYDVSDHDITQPHEQQPRQPILHFLLTLQLFLFITLNYVRTAQNVSSNQRALCQGPYDSTAHAGEIPQGSVIAVALTCGATLSHIFTQVNWAELQSLVEVRSAYQQPTRGSTDQRSATDLMSIAQLHRRALLLRHGFRTFRYGPLLRLFIYQC